MGKKEILVSIAFIVLTVSFCFGNSSCIVNKLSSQVGTQEKTGNNDGEVDKYLISAGFKPNSHNPYCAAFLIWGWKQCGFLLTGTAFAPSWFPQNRVIMENQKGWDNVQDSAGYVFGLFFKTHNRIAHVGYVQSVHRTYIITIEANTSPNAATGEADRNGDGVWRKRRMRKGIFKVARWA